MIVVCSYKQPEGLKRFEYPENPLDSGVPPWGSPMEWAMRIAGISLRELKRPAWIERSDQPASRVTIEQRNRWLLRDPFRSGGGVH
jgi:hypothetical protein